ncbi:hypothetical protein RSOLAG22IIIB_06046 [Rhizoctonia solani]|uniref:Uncharacterized protein n=1 Tax=Rhizoctonia solani TaxID=456999 RepID=A0A0K6GBI3_9AGAM|nr:hypothetical protein RSOLAG22IIIB_06046 [Rhizoctonia solani]
MKGAVAVTLLAALPSALAALSASSLKISDDTLTLPVSFDPIQAAYWTGLPNHRRTPFAVSPDGKSAFLAFLSAAKDAVYVQPVNPTTFASNGDAVKIANAKEAGGLVAHNDGFAIMVTLPVSGTDAPPNSYPVTTLIRYKNGSQVWSTPLNGPGVHVSDGLSASPDMNGDLVYSADSGLYGAYFVVTAYSGWASGHFGDSIQYVNDDGKLQNIAQSSSWGCSHNTGIAFEAASAPPFASVCAEDHGAIWLNTDTRSMNGIKIANENVTNGVSGEPMGGMSGSYSNLAALDGGRYIFAWQSRGAVNLTPDSWMGEGFTQASPRWLNHNVAIATMDAKNKLAGNQAISTVGAASGDDQVNWLTKVEGTDHRNVRVAAAGSGQLAVVTWEELTNPTCEPVPLSCTGTFSGTYAQLVDATGTGSTVGSAINLGKDVTVSGDMVTIGTNVCWPFVKQTWDMSRAKSSGTSVTKMSFACLSTDGSTGKVEAVNSTSQVASSAAEPTATSVTETSAAQTSAPAAESATEPATTSAAAEPTSIVSQPTSVATEPTSAETEPTSTAETEPTSVVEPEPTSTIEPDVTSAVSETTSAPEAAVTESVPTSVAEASSTRRHRPTRYWGRPHGSTSYPWYQAEATASCQ